MKGSSLMRLSHLSGLRIYKQFNLFIANLQYYNNYVLYWNSQNKYNIPISSRIIPAAELTSISTQQKINIICNLFLHTDNTWSQLSTSVSIVTRS